MRDKVRSGRRRELRRASARVEPATSSTGQPFSRGRRRACGGSRGRRGRMLAEDADDGAAEMVAGSPPAASPLPSPVPLSIELGQQPVEAASRSPRSRAAKASLPMPGRVQAHAGGDASGGEVALVALDRRQRLVLRPALEPRLGEGDGDVGAPRLQLRRPRAGRARRLPPAARRPARAASESKNGFDFGRRHGADELVDHRAVAECLHRRDALHAEAAASALVGVDVDLGQQHLAAAAASAASSAGLSALQGPHHSAQKSTTTGVCRESSTTSRSKVASVTSMAMGSD